MRFTIRDLLWLTLLAAVAVAWWVDRARQQAKIRDQQAELVDWQQKTLELAIDRDRERKALRTVETATETGGFPGSRSQPRFGN
jgi:hypothetical protein